MAIEFKSPTVAKNTITDRLEKQGREAKLQEKSVEYTQNNDYQVLPDEGFDGMTKVNVSVDVAVPTIQNSKTVNINTNGTQTISPDNGYDVVEQVVVNTNVQPNLQEKTVNVLLSDTTTNIQPDSGFDGMSSVTVNHPPVESNTAYTATSNGSYTIHPSEGFDATTSVNLTVNVTNPPTAYDISNKYVNITNKNITSKLLDSFSGWENLNDASYKFFDCPKSDSMDIQIITNKMPASNVNFYNAFARSAPADGWTGAWYIKNVSNLPVGSNFERAFCGTQISGGVNLNGSSFRETFYNSAFYMPEANEIILTIDNSNGSNSYVFYLTFRKTRAYRNPLKVKLIKPEGTLVTNNTFNFTNVDNLSVTFTAQDMIASSTFYQVSAKTLNIVFGDTHWNNREESLYSSLIANCISLTTLNIDHIYDNVWLNDSTSLSQESVNNVLNALADGVTGKEITFAGAQYRYITEEQKAAATAKGWTIKSS